ncbi:MAG: hypothetical protein RLZZ385_1920 [Pseudomonadota bacterium]|jgi:riboflavin-specific deaminase-like protein
MNLSQQIEQWLSIEREKFDVADRPFVTLSFAQSWDGSIALRSGAALALSGDESLNLTHHLRSLHDGILVGIGTVLADDPQLTVRMSPGPSPQPIVLDSQLRIPATARLCNPDGRRCWVLSSRDGSSRSDANLDIISLPGDSQGRVCLNAALKELRHRGIASLMVEGGANVITAFLRQRLVDALVLTVAPTLVGGYKAVNDFGCTEKSHLPRISPLHTRRLGEDLIMWGTLQYGGNTP